MGVSLHMFLYTAFVPGVEKDSEGIRSFGTGVTNRQL